MLALAVAAALAALAAQQGSLRAAADAFDDAQLSHDAAALDAFLAPDFQYVTRRGELKDRAFFIKDATTPGEMLQPFEFHDRRVLPLGPSGGVVSAEAVVRGTQDGTRFSGRFRFADVFEKRGGRWVVVYTQVTAPPAK